MLKWIKRRRAERRVLREYKRRLAFAVEAYPHDDIARDGAVEEARRWKRERVQELMR